MPRLYQAYELDEGDVGEDPYYAQALIFGLDASTAFLFGQLSQRPLSRAYYVNAVRQLKEAGYTQFIYCAKERRKVLGGEPLHESLPGFWLVNIGKKQ